MLARCVLLFLVGVHCVSAQTLSAEEKKIHDAIGDFGHVLTQKVTDDVNNVLISPYSVHAALAMTMAGSKGVTENEFSKTLNLVGINKEQVQKGYSSLLSRDHGRGFKLTAANRLYVAKSFAVKPDYKSIVQSSFKADAVNVDFAGEAKKVQNEINSFVNTSTNGLIKNLLPAPLSTSTVVALINTLYFKGDWVKGFREIQDKKPFNTGCAGIQGEVPVWLTKTIRSNYINSAALKSKLILIPYISEGDIKAEMLIILPNEENKCKVKKWLDKVQWNDIKTEITKMQKVAVKLTMPKFELEARYGLQDVLPTMGLKSPFDVSTADFSGISDSKLTISEVIHQTKMIVTKDGTEAAAATVVSISKSAVRFESETVMDVDRSFYVALIYREKDGSSVLPLFSGIVNKLG